MDGGAPLLRPLDQHSVGEHPVGLGDLEVALETAESWRQLWESSPVGYAIFDRDLRFRYINPALAELNGRSVEEHHDMLLRDILAPTAYEVIEPLIQTVFRSGEPVQRVDLVGRPVRGGDLGAWLAYYSPLRNAEGQVVAVSSTIVEASETFRERLFVETRDTRMRLLLEATNAVTFTMYPTGEMTAFASTWPKYTGQTEMEAHGWGWLDKIHPEDRAWVKERWKETIATATPLLIEARLWSHIHQDHRYSEIRLVPVYTRAGTIREWAGLALDVHPRVMALADRERLLEAERVARLESEKANLLKDEFVATISHELRTPLTTIMGWSDLLDRSGLDPQSLASGLREIRTAVNRQAQMIEDLLDISRLAMGKLPLQLEEVCLAEVLEGSLEAMRPRAMQKQIELEGHLPPGRVPFEGDPVRLRQVFENIIGNAIKFTPTQGTIAVTLEVLEGKTARVTIQDSGEGIPPEVLPFIFDRFRQGDSSATRRHGGLGLGLAIVRELVLAHGGKVGAESEGLGKGARFTLEFSVGKVPKEIVHHDLPAPTPRPSNRALKGLSILMVEDDLATLGVVKLMLVTEGAEVTTAHTTDAARQLLRSRRFSCVLCDIAMPQEDGFRFLESVRDEGILRLEETPAIAVTAFGRDEDRQRAIQAGFTGFLTKPMRVQDLVQAILSSVYPLL